MGLLDNFNMDDPRAMGLLSAGLSMLGNSGASRTPVNLGQILGGGLQAYQGVQDDFRKRKQQEEEYAIAKQIQNMQRQQSEMQMGELLRKKEMDAAIRSAYKDAYTPESKVVNPEWNAVDPQSVNLPQTLNKPASLDMKNLASKLMSVGAFDESMAIQKQMRGDNYKLGKGERLFSPENKLIAEGFVDAPKSDAITPYQAAQLALEEKKLAQSNRHFNAAQANKALASERKPMTALQEAKYRDQMAGDYKALDAAIATMNDVSRSSQNLLENKKGLSGITGLQSYLYSFPNSAAAKADVSLQNLKGKITQLGKVAASSGGAIGAIANQEWKIMSDMVAAIDPAKGDEAMKQQISELNSYAEGAARRMADAYDKQYSVDFEAYPQFKTPSLVDVSRVPKEAVNMLKMNPKLRNDFDEKYGAGAASRILGK